MAVLIVEALAPPVLRWLESRHTIRYVPEYATDPRALRAALGDARAIVVPPSVPVDAELLRAAPKLRAIGRVSAGAENIDLDACRRANVEVVRRPAASDPAEAEFVIGALLSMLRRLPVIDPDGLPVGRELGAATVGLLGVSAEAELLTRRLAGFGSRVIGYDPARHASDGLYGRLGIRPVSLPELFEQSDALTIQLADVTRYGGLIGDRLLQTARQDQVLVCLTQSAIFDEAALARALTAGPLGGAWLDSVEPGARDFGRPLRGIDRLQITPRIAATTRESRLRSGWAVARRIDALLQGA